MKELDPNESNPAILWAEIHRLRAAIKGPDGYETWQDAAVAERLLRVQSTTSVPTLTDEQFEQRIRALGLAAPRVTPEHIKQLIVGETYTILPSGKVMVCELTLRNGFSVRGESAVVSKENFNEETGRIKSRQRAVDKIWELEGYLLQDTLYKRVED